MTVDAAMVAESSVSECFLLFLILTSVKLTLKLPLPFIICHCLSLEHKVDPFVFMVLKVEGRSLQEPQFLFHLNLTFQTKNST